MIGKATAFRSRTVVTVGLLVLVAAGVASWIAIVGPSATIYLTAGWIALVAALLWLGNTGLTRLLDRLMPWHRAGSFRLFTHMFFGLVFLLLMVNITYVLLKVILTEGAPTGEQIIVTNVFGVVMFVPAFSIYFSLHFLRHWRQSVLEKETMQKEQMRSQLLSLKHQLDPHFLFNNLNILAALVDHDPVRSRRFIEKFADVYRALLRTNTDDLVTLREELEFIDAYMYLLRTRFDDVIHYHADLSRRVDAKMLPPLTLQLLVENAIKHNTFHETAPMTIQLLQPQDDYLVVRNSLSEKKPSRKKSGSGLANIRARYAYFTDKPVRIIRTDTHFEVHIPLLEKEL